MPKFLSRVNAMNQLEQLRQYTTVVADTGNFKELAAFAPRDATTDPALVVEAAQQPDLAALIDETVAAHKGLPLPELADVVLVRFGVEALKIVPGRVSTEIDCRVAFDTAATIARAHHVVSLYERAGIERERLLIKIAATWEGIQAAKALQHEGIRSHLTLVFSFCQALCCAEAGARLVTPLVGRAYDWCKRAAGASWDEAAHAGADDPGVELVTRIYTYYKHFGIDTEVMATSFRNSGQIVALAGCDLMAIEPERLAELQASDAPVVRRLDPKSAEKAPVHAMTHNEAAFRWALNENAMATEKLAEGIREFAADAVRLERLIEAGP